jgi:hypothetical protein
MPTAAANVSFFVKDVYDYPAATQFNVASGTAGNPVPVFEYLNGHFARSKGFEIEVEKRRSNYWSGKISYTFQQTKGKSSDPNEQKEVEATGGSATETRLSESYVSWNRPHKLSVTADVRFDKQAPSGLGWLKQSGLNIFVQGESGRPYTPLNSQGNSIGAPDSKNAPFQITTDLRANHWFLVGGRRLELSLAALNVFANKLIYRVDPQTGKGRVWGVGSYDYHNPYSSAYDANNPNGNQFVYVSDLLDPSNYGPGAQWRLSLDYDF